MTAPPDPNQDGSVLDGSGSRDAQPSATPPTGLAEPWLSGSRFEVPVVREQAERVDALGALAAGIAHEFNNLLTIVLGSLEQLRRQPLDERGQTQLDRAEWGVRQAGRLSRQVLSFAHRQRSETRIVDLNEVVGQFDKLLGHAAGDGASLVLQLAPQPLPARLDAGQLELALLNLVRNAADAMPAAGSIIVRTAGHPVDGLGGQPTVEVSVSDAGTGMPPEVLERATNAFFTTKEPGRGTGLGLWMVERFVAAWGGRMDVQTAVGEGPRSGLSSREPTGPDQSKMR